MFRNERPLVAMKFVKSKEELVIFSEPLVALALARLDIRSGLISLEAVAFSFGEGERGVGVKC